MPTNLASDTDGGTVLVLGLGLVGEHDTVWLIRELRRRFPSFAILACGAGAGAVCAWAAPASAIAAAEIVVATHGDKKARRGRVEYVLPARIGEMAGAASGYGVPLDDAFVMVVGRT